MSEESPVREPRALHILIASIVYAPEEIVGPVAVVIEQNAIAAVWRDCDAEAAQQLAQQWIPGAQVTVTDLRPWRLAPGYIDIHTHGFGGYDITNGSSADITAITRRLPASGVTAFFPTIATSLKAETARQVERIVTCAESQDNVPAAAIVGVRLEGPFISHKKKGAQYEPGIRPPDPVEIEELVQLGKGWIKILDFAPEEDQDHRFLTTLLKLDILPCIGHTAATYEQALSALDRGARHSTHLFNAMSPLDHRSPGVPGALLTDRRATVEVIADGIHVHPAMLKLAVAARGRASVALITDAVTAAGLPDGEYMFGGRQVNVANGAVRLSDGTLAGSTLTMERAVRNIVSFLEVGWSTAIHMATLTPAQISGLSRKGRIAPGMDADLVALDNAGSVMSTWTRGHLAYHRE